MLEEKISQAVFDLLTDAVKNKNWTLPIFAFVVGANGGMSTGAFVSDEHGNVEYMRRTADGDYEMPINIILVSEKGEALRLVLEESLIKPTLKDFLN